MIRQLLTLLSVVGAFASASVGQDRPVTFLSYNILNGMKLDTTEGKSAFSTWFKAMDPDVLGLQEMQKFTQKSLEEFARGFGHPYAVLLKEDGHPIALTSKYPIVNVEKVTDNLHHGFIRAQVKGYDIIVLHFSPHKYWKRREEAALVIETVRSQNPEGKWILMGDFNSESPLDAEMYKDGELALARAAAQVKYPIHDNLVTGSLEFEAMQRFLDAGFVDAVLVHSGAKQSSQPTRRFMQEQGRAVPRRVDYALVSPNLRGNVVNARIVKDEFTDMYSDHYPVWLELKR